MKYIVYFIAVIAMSLLIYGCDNAIHSAASSVQDETLMAPQQVSPAPYEPNNHPEKLEVAADKSNADTVTESFNTEDYDNIVENKFLSVTQQPLSTFSIDVDRASYANVRRFIDGGSLPPKGAVRLEEMINYFDYNYAQPTGNDPLTIYTEVATCPWNTNHRLIQIGLQGKKISTDNLPASNLVFLIDVSGSMDEPDKLPLVQQSLKLLTDQLREQDRVAIVVYAGNAGLVLPSTSGADKMKIKDAIDALSAGGSTAGGEGIELAYKIAEQNLKPHANNCVILATDGDFNIGASSDDALVTLIEKERQSGIYLSVLGFGMGNYKDNKMQQLADKGNGNHNYIDNIDEAKKVLVNEFGGTLFTIAKDVKLQIEFNPQYVQAYRLMGYENRLLANEDFNDDKKDAGELGSGHTVTALYEIIPAGINDTMISKVDDLKYQSTRIAQSASTEMMTIKIRYKQPESDVSKLLVYPVINSDETWEESSDNFRFSSAVAEFGLMLRSSSYKQHSSYQQLIKMAKGAESNDVNGYRSAFVQLAEKAAALSTSANSLQEDKETGTK